jgi:regulator of replication initiation timing
MSTTYDSFKDIKEIVNKLESLENNLSTTLKQLSEVKLVVKQLLQDKLCFHTSTRQWRDFSDYHKATSCETCNNCGKDLK